MNILLKVIISLAILIGGLWLPQLAFATSGACSYHGGVNCSAGPDWDGSVVCNDGWTDSSVSYSAMAMCQPHNSYPTTPTCPSMSSYNSLTGQCSCYPGYVVGTDFMGKQACVSAASRCTDLLGLMSQYNSLTERCECMSGYEFNGSSCVYKSSSNSYSVDHTPSTYVPAPVGNTNESCIKDHGPRSILGGNTCICQDNFMFNGSKQCVPAGDACVSEYGEGAIPFTYSECTCAYGYHLESGRHCAINPKPIKIIPENIKVWADKNLGLGIMCDSNKEFDTSELKVCTEYVIDAHRHEFEWQVVNLAPTTRMVTPTPTPEMLSAPQTPKSKPVLQKPKEQESKIHKSTQSTTTVQIERQNNPTTTDVAIPLIEKIETLIPPPLPPIQKTFWHRAINWFRFW